MAKNPFEHHHDHDHDHDHDEVAHELDPAQQSLADALRVSFTVLKIAMAVLVVWYLFSGFFSVPSGKVAVRLRFGKIVGSGKEQIIQPGNLNFAFPYPIEDHIYIPTSPRQIDLTREFWFDVPANLVDKTTDEQAAGKSGPLDPEKDGSLLTGDANIVHARWSLSYRVADPVAYALNVGNEKSAEQIVRAAAEEGIVLSVAERTADDLIRGQFDRDVAVRHVQRALDGMATGIQIEPKLFTLSQAIIPLSVRMAYEAVIKAENEKAQAIEQAQNDRSKTLGATAGEAHRPLGELINQYELATAASDEATLKALDARLDWVFTRLEAPRWAARPGKLTPADQAELWSLYQDAETARRSGNATAAREKQEKYTAALERLGVPADVRSAAPVSGEVAGAMNDASSYRSTALADVEREANIFQNWFNVYKGQRDVRKIVEARLWQETKAQVLTGDVETFYMPPGQSYLELNRDPAVVQARQEAKMKADEEARKAAGAKAQAEAEKKMK